MLYNHFKNESLSDNVNHTNTERVLFFLAEQYQSINRKIYIEKAHVMQVLEYITLKSVISTLVGGLLGYGYYRFVGCRSGACPISCNPYISTIYGSVLGFVWTMK